MSKKRKTKVALVRTPARSDDEAAKRATRVWLSFKDLVAEGILGNWQTLSAWQRDEGFPKGKLLGPNSRRWSRSEVETWIASRPAT